MKDEQDGLGRQPNQGVEWPEGSLRPFSPTSRLLLKVRKKPSDRFGWPALKGGDREAFGSATRNNALEELMPEVNDVKDLGAGVIHGIECDHFAFRTKEVDRQIWIAQGARAYPCRYVITSKKVTGWPQYTLDTWAWKTGTEVASDSFKLAIPAGAKKLTPAEVPEFNDLPAHFTVKGAK